MSSEIIYNEKDLLMRVAQGDRTAFSELYKVYFPSVHAYVLIFGLSGSDLAEMTQGVFVRVWEKRDKLAGINSFKAYLRTLTRNHVLNYMRALKLHRMHQVAGEDETPAGTDPESLLLYKQYYSLALEAMDKLPPGRKKVLKMSLDEGLTLDEIAAALDISRAGVKKQLYAATAFVRQYLQEHGEMTLLLFVFLSLFEI